MAGGQERILKERIRSVRATKKITRAMELIAASRIVKAQARVAAAVPYSELITDVVKDLAAGGASADSPLLAGRDEIEAHLLRGDHRRPWAVWRLQRRCPARRRG
jgi:F-type H+-transporting ATPase subunit gamma